MNTQNKLILGITGSIAAYKSLDLLRALQRQGYDVWVVMTKHAERFVSPLSFETLSHHPVFTDMFSQATTIPLHIDLTKDVKAVLIAPATANIIAKAASGIADDLLSTIILSSEAPLIFVPAMNYRMWQALVTQKNIAYLKSIGSYFIEPETGELACQEIGKGHFPALDVILSELAKILLSKQSLAGKKIVVTAGRTEEAIDPIRVLTNRASGRLGVLIAQALEKAGAKVILVAANLNVDLPFLAKTIKVISTDEMLKVLLNEMSDADALVMTAAVSDFSPSQVSSHKRKDQEISLKLRRTPDILKAIRKKYPDKYLIGFSVDTHNQLQSAQRKLTEKKLNLIIANPVDTIGSEYIQPTLIFTDRKQKLERLTKQQFSEKLVSIISQELGYEKQ